MSFFDESAKQAITAAVKEAESRTAGEIVIVVRPSSDGYRHVTLAVGLVMAAAVLCVFLYHPQPFDFTYLPLELAGAFAIGALASLGFPIVRRSLVSRRAMARAVKRAACEAFVDRRVHRTKGRTGVLVCVSVLERHVEIVADVGVDAKVLTTDGLAAAVRAHDPNAFAAAIVSLGASLGKVLPRAADDENELPDAPEEVA